MSEGINIAILNTTRNETDRAWDHNPEFFIESFELYEHYGLTKHHETAKLILDICRPKSILEIGSGTGILYRALLKNGFRGRYLGLDITQAFVDHCTNLFGPDLFRVGDAASFKFKRKFDVCIMQDVLRHNSVERRYQILINTVPYVKKYLVLSEPLGEDEKCHWVEADISQSLTIKKNSKINQDRLYFLDGTVNLNKLMECIQTIKPIISMGKRVRGGLFESDLEIDMHEHLLMFGFVKSKTRIKDSENNA